MSSQEEDGSFDRRRFLKASGAGAVAVSLAGCGGQQGEGEDTETTMEETETTMESTETTASTPEQEGPSYGGTFTFGMANNPDSPSPMLSGSVYSAVGVGLVYDGPIASNPSTFQPEPWVYTDWEIRNVDNDDPIRCYWNVRDGVQFGDGSEMTMEDIQFSYDYIIGNQVGEYSIHPYFQTESVDSAPEIGKPDGAELPVLGPSDEANWDMQTTLSGPTVNWQFYTIGGIDIIPRSVWEGTNFKQFNPVEEGAAFGTGPGQMTRFQKDTSMQVQIVNDYYRETLNQLDWVQENDLRIAGGPFIDTFNFQVFGSESAMTQAFLEGEIDAHYGSIQPSREEEVQNTEGRGLINGPSDGFGYFGYNVLRQPFDDLTLRQAMNFAWDERFWVQTLQGGSVINGDYPQSPGYPAGRPETYNDAEIAAAPETELYQFRSESEGSPAVDAEGIRSFLTNGEVATGEGGTYVGTEYVGGFYDDISAGQTEAKYDYSFGPAQSQVIRDTAGVEQELRVNGQTIPEFKEANSNPVTIITDPASSAPRQIKAMQTWATNLRQVGIPVQLKTLSANTLFNQGSTTHDFDVMEAGWAGTSPYGISNYYFFHPQWWTESQDDYDYNYTGYGQGEVGSDAVDLLETAFNTVDINEASRMFAKSMEKIYLDSPYRVWSYSKVKWPVNTADFAGYVSGVANPAFTNWFLEANNIHQRN